jgi:hypothetical protein
MISASPASAVPHIHNIIDKHSAGICDTFDFCSISGLPERMAKISHI